MRCSCCKAAVHESAYNHIEKKTTFVVGESVMRWGVATQALEKQDKPAIARIEVRPTTTPVSRAELSLTLLEQLCRCLHPRWDGDQCCWH